MFDVEIPLKVMFSERWSGKEGNALVTLTAVIFGTKVMKVTVAENRVPDVLEGHEAIGIFAIGIGNDFKPFARFKGLKGAV